MDVGTEMATNPFYSELFWGAFSSNTVAHSGSDMVFFAMLYFGGFTMTLAATLAILGATLGMLVNLALGLVFSKVQDAGVSKLEAELYSKWQRRANALMPFIGIFSFIPLVSVLVVIAGFFRVNRKVAVASILFGQATYYDYYLSTVS